MKVRIKAPFATASRTADVLKVSKSRLRVLERLVDANTNFNGTNDLHKSETAKTAVIKSKVGPKKRAVKSNGSGKGRTRGKV